MGGIGCWSVVLSVTVVSVWETLSWCRSFSRAKLKQVRLYFPWLINDWNLVHIKKMYWCNVRILNCMHFLFLFLKSVASTSVTTLLTEILQQGNWLTCTTVFGPQSWTKPLVSFTSIGRGKANCYKEDDNKEVTNLTMENEMKWGGKNRTTFSTWMVVWLRLKYLNL